MIKKFCCEIKKAFRNKRVSFTQEEYNKVLNFYKYHQDFRDDISCARFTGIEIFKCNFLKNLCYKNRDLGMYYFEARVAPQKYMLEYILKNTNISKDSRILEIGPGNCPIFDPHEFCCWCGVDKNWNGDSIFFNEHIWAQGKYDPLRMFAGGWENLSTVFENQEKFDFVVASHSYEHVFEPIKSLIEASKVLKKDGWLILFVPDGFSDEPAARTENTHTLYLVPQMIEEFFSYAEVFYDLKIESFRPNYDYVIMGKKK